MKSTKNPNPCRKQVCFIHFPCLGPFLNLFFWVLVFLPANNRMRLMDQNENKATTKSRIG